MPGIDLSVWDAEACCLGGGGGEFDQECFISQMCVLA